MASAALPVGGDHQDDPAKLVQTLVGIVEQQKQQLDALQQMVMQPMPEEHGTSRNTKKRRAQQTEDQRCHKCQKIGHTRKDCQLSSGACFRCGQKGHKVSECQQKRMERKLRRALKTARRNRNPVHSPQKGLAKAEAVVSASISANSNDMCQQRASKSNNVNVDVKSNEASLEEDEEELADETSEEEETSEEDFSEEPFSGQTVPRSTVALAVNPALGGLLSSSGNPVKEIDETKLFVGYLPLSLNDDKLVDLFLPFGPISEAVVIKDKNTGLSKGYGFVKYVDTTFAAEATARMNGYRIDGKILAVRVAGRSNKACEDANRLSVPCSLTASTLGSSTGSHQVGSLPGSRFLTRLSSQTIPCSFVSLPANSSLSGLSSYNSNSAKGIDQAKLFVGQLPESVDENKLIELFLPYGQLCEATIIKDKNTGLSKGYGFVKYVDTTFASQAIARMNGYRIEGKTLAVRVAGRFCYVCGDANHVISACPLTASIPGNNTTSRQIDSRNYLGNRLISPFSGQSVPSFTMPLAVHRAPGDLSSAIDNPVKGIDEAKLYVGDLPLSVNNDKLIDLFLPFGQIRDAAVIRDKITGLSRGYGFVTFVNATVAAQAIARMNGYMIEGKMIVVRVAGHQVSTTSISTVSVDLSRLVNPPTASLRSVAQVNPDPVSWPGHPSSMLPDYYTSFPKNGDFLSQTVVGREAPAHFGVSLQTPSSSYLIHKDVPASSELAHFPGFLNSL